MMTDTIKRLTARFLAALLLLALTPVSGLCQGASVAVFPIKNNGQAQYASLASGLSSMIATDLTKSMSLDVVDPARVDKAMAGVRLTGGAPGAEDALKAAASLDADYAVTGEFVVFGGKFRIDIRVYDVKTGALKAAEKAQAKEDAFFDMVEELSGKVILAITGSMPVAGSILQVESDPSGAQLLIDGVKAGNTPASVKDLSAGVHKLEINLEGYKPFAQTVTLKAGETTKVEAKLIRLFGGIRVWWKDYPGSDVSIGGEVIRMVQFQFNTLGKYCKNLPAGHYTVTARMPYKDESAWDNTRAWRTYTAEVDVNPGEVLDVFLDNNLFSPGIEPGACAQCAADWDFDTDIVWFETR